MAHLRIPPVSVSIIILLTGHFPRIMTIHCTELTQKHCSRGSCCIWMIHPHTYRSRTILCSDTIISGLLVKLHECFRTTFFAIEITVIIEAATACSVYFNWGSILSVASFPLPPFWRAGRCTGSKKHAACLPVHQKKRNWGQGYTCCGPYLYSWDS